MWIMSTHGFVSVVQHRRDPELLMVRARVEDDLHAWFPGKPVKVDAGADYLYRVVVTRDEFAMALLAEAEGIDYDSHVKEEISERAPEPLAGNRYLAMLKTWAAFEQLQPGVGPPRELPGKGDAAGGERWDWQDALPLPPWIEAAA